MLHFLGSQRAVQDLVAEPLFKREISMYSDISVNNYISHGSHYELGTLLC